MTTGTKITIAVVLVIIIVAIFLAMGKTKKQAREELEAGVGVKTGAVVKGNYAAAAKVPAKKPGYNDLPLGSFPLKQSAGANKLTWLLQSVLNALHNAKLTVDGVFGPATETALFNSYRVREVDKAVATRIYQVLASKTVQSPNYAQLAEQFKGTMAIIT